MKNKEIILFDAESSARFVENISGWVDINNRFWGNNTDSERMARYSSCTHQKCECGELMAKGWTKCDKCRTKSTIDRYNLLPFKEWDGKEIVYSDMAERYFTDSEEIEDYLDDNEIEPKELRLFICEPNEFKEIDQYTLSENENILISDLAAPIYKPIQHTVECTFDFADLEAIQLKPFGYIKFSDELSGYLLNLKKKNNEAKAEITIIEKV